MARPGYISFDKPKPKSPPLSEGSLIVFEECRPGQVYTATDGSTMKILEQTKSGRYLIFLNDKKAGIIENNPDEKYTDKALRDLIVEHGFVLSSQGAPDAPAIGETPATPASNVVNLDDVRGKSGQPSVDPEGTEVNKAVSEAERMLADMEVAKEGVMKKLTECMEKMQPVIDLIRDEEGEELRTQIVKMSVEVSSLYVRFLAAEQERKNTIPDESYLKNQQKLLDDAQDFDIEAQMLLDKVQNFLESLESQDETQAGSGVSADSVHSASNVGVGDGANPPEQADKKGGDGGDGTEPPVEAILRDIRQYVMEIISKIDTIEEYQKFRDGMATVPARDDRPERRVFIDIGGVRKRLGRRLEDREVQWVNNLEKDIQAAARKKKNDIVEREFHSFSESSKGQLALIAYEEILRKEWEMFDEDLDKTAFGKEWNREQRITFWEKEFYPAVEMAVLKDIQEVHGLDRARSELIFGVLLGQMSADWQYHQQKDAKHTRNKK